MRMFLLGHDVRSEWSLSTIIKYLVEEIGNKTKESLRHQTEELNSFLILKATGAVCYFMSRAVTTINFIKSLALVKAYRAEMSANLYNSNNL